MANHLFLIFIALQSTLIHAQEDIYPFMELGTHQIGYYDTVIFDDSKAYSEFGYSGGMPFFVSIWHPIKSDKKDYLRYGDFRKRELEGPLKKVYEMLVTHMDSAFTWYNVAQDFDDYKAIDYKEKSAYAVQKEICNYTTRIQLSQLNTNNKYPVILYHHGAQGLSDENYLMAEYFASHGYIVVAANFHWPYAAKSYAQTPNKTYNTDAAKFMIDFSKSLSTSNQNYFIGHSWGAQTGFSILYEDLGIDAFVSMETTLEYYDSTKIKKTWSRLYDIMKEHHSDYQIPMLLFANDGKESPFTFRFYEQIENAKMIHASCKEYFGHESYTGIYLLRYLYRAIYEQPDVASMKTQLDGYLKHLKLIHAFIQSHGKLKDLKEFEADFYLKQLNY